MCLRTLRHFHFTVYNIKYCTLEKVMFASKEIYAIRTWLLSHYTMEWRSRCASGTSPDGTRLLVRHSTEAPTRRSPNSWLTWWWHSAGRDSRVVRRLCSSRPGLTTRPRLFRLGRAVWANTGGPIRGCQQHSSTQGPCTRSRTCLSLNIKWNVFILF